jgi:hypothetical protein
MTPDQFDSLRRACHDFITTNKLNPARKNGKHAIHTWWCGALHGANQTHNARVNMLILSGRYEELLLPAAGGPQ